MKNNNILTVRVHIDEVSPEDEVPPERMNTAVVELNVLKEKN